MKGAKAPVEHAECEGRSVDGGETGGGVDRGTRARRRVRGPDLAALGVVAAATAAFLMFSLLGRGAIPHNDDWSFIKSALLLHQTGDIRLQGWGQMFMLGQLITAQPLLVVLGPRVAALQLYGVAMTAVWLWCSYLLARRCVSPRRAVLVILGLALWPGLPLLASSFMTDMPAAAMSLLTVVLGLRALERHGRGWLLLSLLVGIFAFTIREQFVAGVGALVVVSLLDRRVRPRFRLEVLIGAVVAAAVCVVLEHVRHGMQYADLAPFALDPSMLEQVPPTLIRVPFTLGLALAPLSAWSLVQLRGRAGWLDVGRLLGWLVAVAALISVAAPVFPRIPQATLGNYVTPRGAFPVAVVGRLPEVIPTTLWQTVQVVSILSGVVILGELGAAIRRLLVRRPAAFGTAGLMLGSYTALMLVAAVALAFAGERQYDRYGMGVLPGLATLLVAAVPVRARRRRGADPGARVGSRGRVPAMVLCALLCCLMAWVATGITVATHRRDRAVWDESSRLVQQGVPATQINAGLDWDGFHAATPTTHAYTISGGYHGRSWISLFPTSGDCYIVSVDRINRSFAKLVRIRPGSAGLGPPTVFVYSFKEHNPVCGHSTVQP